MRLICRCSSLRPSSQSEAFFRCLAQTVIVSAVSSGAYLVRLQAQDAVESRKIVLVR